MDKFATIEFVVQYRKITYYTVIFDDEDESLFLQFINHFEATHREELDIIRFWLLKLGREIGADERYFRFEAFRGGDARALPPPARFINADCSLRLYCMRVNQSVVILFGGAEKTTRTAQDCPKVGPHFQIANQLTQAIDQAIKDQEIRFDPNDDTLIIEEDLTLII